MTHSQPEGFLAVPSNGSGRGVLVLHAWWGLNDTIKNFCARLADAGFVAFAPDLYHGKIADTIPDAEILRDAFDANALQAQTEIADAVKFLNARADQTENGLAVIGFSLGAYFALELSDTDPEHIRSVVIFYGTGVDDFSHSRANYLCHFAENDPFEPLSGVEHLKESLERAERPATIYIYPDVGHWFFEPDRVDAYNESAARLAWERTLEFLKQPDELESNH